MLKILYRLTHTLYGGKKITGSISGVKGAPAKSVSESDLVVGDVVVKLNGELAGAYFKYVHNVSSYQLFR